MSSSVAVKPDLTRVPWLTRLARRLVLSRLELLANGELVIAESQGELRFGQRTDACPVTARIEVANPSMYAAFAFGGSVGAGESYMAGDWRADNLTDVTRVFAANLSVLESVDGGLARLKSPLRRLLHALNNNTRRGSARNIAAHYDLGNEFFSLFLDESLMYSSAVFPHSQASLEEAAAYKNELICKKLRLGPDDHLLEIGTGWGGFAVHAASRFGCRVTTTTISSEQYAEAEKRIRAAGLEERIRLLKRDYRDLDGTYDKLVSIEMIEAVGHQFLETYFEKCSSLLKPHGLMALQAITIPAQRYDRAVRNVDFIKRYIFPGGFLPSITAISNAVKRKTDLDFIHIENIAPHYAETLKHWRRRFTERLAKVRAQGYPETFIRMWEYYLSYCEGAFRERVIGTSQLLLAKPHFRGELPGG